MSALRRLAAITLVAAMGCGERDFIVGEPDPGPGDGESEGESGSETEADDTGGPDDGQGDGQSEGDTGDGGDTDDEDTDAGTSEGGAHAPTDSSARSVMTAPHAQQTTETPTRHQRPRPGARR